MSSVLQFSPRLSLELEQRSLIQPGDRCRFCQCTEETPCIIPVCEDLDGQVRLARTEAEATDIIPCGWFLPRVCNSPTCIEKLIAEWRELPVLFDPFGHELHAAGKGSSAERIR